MLGNNPTIRIVVDGKKLSSKYVIRPYNDFHSPDTSHFYLKSTNPSTGKVESEETVISTTPNLNIKPFIQEIHILLEILLPTIPNFLIRSIVEQTIPELEQASSFPVKIKYLEKDVTKEQVLEIFEKELRGHHTEFSFKTQKIRGLREETKDSLVYKNIVSKLYKDKNLTLLGGGDSGTAFKTGNKLVLKVTTDKGEYLNAKRTEGKPTEYLNTVYKTEEIHPGIFTIIQDYTEDIPIELQKELKPFEKQIFRYIEGKENLPESLSSKLQDFLKGVKKELSLYNIEETEVDYANYHIRIKQGKLKLIDY